MFSIPGLVLLLVFIYARPLEFLPQLRGTPVLYILFALALFGWALDVSLRRSRLTLAPQSLWVFGFYLWCLFTLLLRNPGLVGKAGVELAIAVSLFLLLSLGIQTFRSFEVVIGVVLALVLGLSAIGIHQGLAPFGCHLLDPQALAEGNESIGVFDGRPCQDVKECFSNDAEPGADYLCERAGLLGTHSVGRGRVRYLGPLQDPNELALAIGVGLPFAFAFLERRRTLRRRLLLWATLLGVALCTIYTKSRGGQLVFASVLAVYFVKRRGWKGLVIGAVLAAPLLFFGGRGGAEAAGSSAERLECWYEGMSMFRGAPLTGVGFTLFNDYHFLTAHNSYILAGAELGLPGLVLWLTVMYLSLKIPLKVLSDLADDPGAEVARSWALAMTAAMVGLLVGVFFLSFNYKQMLWIYVGLSGALHAAVRTHRPDWSVKLSARELVGLVLGAGLLMVAMFVYTRLKVG